MCTHATSGSLRRCTQPYQQSSIQNPTTQYHKRPRVRSPQNENVCNISRRGHHGGATQVSAGSDLLLGRSHRALQHTAHIVQLKNSPNISRHRTSSTAARRHMKCRHAQEYFSSGPTIHSLMYHLYIKLKLESRALLPYLSSRIAGGSTGVALTTCCLG